MASLFIDDDVSVSGDASSDESAVENGGSGSGSGDADSFLRRDDDSDESDLRTSESGISQNEIEGRREKRRRLNERAEEAARILNDDQDGVAHMPRAFQNVINSAAAAAAAAAAVGAESLDEEDDAMNDVVVVSSPAAAPAAEEEEEAQTTSADEFLISGANGSSFRVTKSTRLPVKKESYQGGNRRQTRFQEDGAFSSFRLPDEIVNEDPRSALINIEMELESIRESNGFAEGFSTRALSGPLFDDWLHSLCQYRWAQFVPLEQSSKDMVLEQVHSNCYEIYRSLRLLAWRCVRAKEVEMALKTESETMFTSIENTYTIFRQLVEAFFIQWMAFEMDGVYHAARPRIVRVPISLLEDLQIQEGEDPTKNDLLECKDKLRELAKLLRMRRVDKQIFEPVYVTSEAGINSFAWAYKLWGSVDDWVVQAVKRHYGRDIFVAFEGKKGNANEIKAYFRERDGLIQLQFTRHMISFQNGVYFPNRDLFVSHTDMTEDKLIAPHVYSCTYIECDFNEHPTCRDVDLPLPTSEGLNDYVKVPQPRGRRSCAWDIPTPAFEKIMNDQGWSYEVQVSMYIMFGRLLYDQDYFDSEQLALFCWGRKETGKSTLCNVASRIYPSHLVGSCSTRQEATFGLQGYLNKYVIIQPEVTKSWRMEQSDFLKMIAGDIVAVQKKYSIPEDVEWRSPLIMAGNEVPGWADDHSAIARRLAIFYFSKGIVRDANMENQLKREIANIIVKSNRFYRAAAFMFQSKRIPWPAYFTNTRRDFLKETSPIYEYLCSSDLVSGEQYSMPFEILIQNFRAFHKNRADRKQLNTTLAVWRVAVEEWGAKITEDPERHMYNNTTIRDNFVIGADLRRNVPIGFADGTL